MPSRRNRNRLGYDERLKSLLCNFIMSRGYKKKNIFLCQYHEGEMNCLDEICPETKYIDRGFRRIKSGVKLNGIIHKNLPLESLYLLKNIKIGTASGKRLCSILHSEELEQFRV